ncbi:MAG TPA: hypothetical protein VFS77_00060, partial [Pyrinomonadaceae bacterium]|nr:hypothetical protein [Pyrinomonadaceae bacterium]
NSSNRFAKQFFTNNGRSDVHAAQRDANVVIVAIAISHKSTKSSKVRDDLNVPKITKKIEYKLVDGFMIDWHHHANLFDLTYLSPTKKWNPYD